MSTHDEVSSTMTHIAGLQGLGPAALCAIGVMAGALPAAPASAQPLLGVPVTRIGTFDGHDYYITQHPVGIQEARRISGSVGRAIKQRSYVAAIDSLTEWLVIGSQLAPGTAYWIGLSDEREEGVFLLDCGSGPSFTLFPPGGPADPTGDRDFVVASFDALGGSFESVTDGPRPAIIEVEVESDGPTCYPDSNPPTDVLFTDNAAMGVFPGFRLTITADALPTLVSNADGDPTDDDIPFIELDLDGSGGLSFADLTAEARAQPGGFVLEFQFSPIDASAKWAFAGALSSSTGTDNSAGPGFTVERLGDFERLPFIESSGSVFPTENDNLEITDGEFVLLTSDPDAGLGLDLDTGAAFTRAEYIELSFRLNGTEPCDYNTDGQIDRDDVTLFLAELTADPPYPRTDTTQPRFVEDVFDLAAQLNACSITAP